MHMRMDADGAGKIPDGEFHDRKRPLASFSKDGGGFMSRPEIVAAFGGGGRRKKKGRSRSSAPPKQAPETSDGRTAGDAPDQVTLCAIGRGRSYDIKLAIERGLFETGLRPRFPENARCRDIDEQYAISYTHKRPRENYYVGAVGNPHHRGGRGDRCGQILG
jgi:hypothetical protein